MTVVTVHRALGYGGKYRSIVLTVDGRESDARITHKQPAVLDLAPGRHRVRARLGAHSSNVLDLDVSDEPVSLVVRLAQPRNPDQPMVIEQSDDLSFHGPGILDRAPLGRFALPLGLVLLAIGVFEFVIANWFGAALALVAAVLQLAPWVYARRRPAPEESRPPRV